MSEQINLDIERYVIDYIQPKIQTILTQLSILCWPITKQCSILFSLWLLKGRISN